MNAPEGGRDRLIGVDGQLEGVVLSRTAGFYTVQLPSGREVVCLLRGRVRKEDVVLVGDRVRVSLTGDGRGVVEEVLARTNRLHRPPVANITRVVAVVALARPEPDLELLDRLLVVAEAAGLSPLVCFNKADLVKPEQVQPLVEIYRQAGYSVAVTSALTGYGLGPLREQLRGHVSTLSGPSGVGKSALINALCPEAGQATGEVSERLGRGRHTTRTVRLLPLPEGGLLADTPGFSRLDLSSITPRQLPGLMRDIARLSAGCRFGSGCLHVAEPDCAVREAVQQGALAPSRYHHYRRLLEELTELEARRYS